MSACAILRTTIRGGIRPSVFAKDSNHIVCPVFFSVSSTGAMRSIGLRVPLARRLVTGRALPLRTAVPLVRLEEHGARGQHHHQQQQGGALPARRWAVIGVRELHGSPPRLAEIIMNVPQ